MNDDDMIFGTIEAFDHIPGSGLASLYVHLEEGGLEAIHGDDRCIFKIAEDFDIGERVGITYGHPFSFGGPAIHKLEAEA